MPGQRDQPLLENIFRTCKQVAESQSSRVMINTEAINILAQQLNDSAVKYASQAARYPVRFETQLAEVNFMALFHLLDFGSGYESELQAQLRRGSRETLQFAMMGLHLSNQPLDARWMKSFDAYGVQNFFGIQSHQDHNVPHLPGVSMSRPGPLLALTQLLATAVSETGRILEEDLGCGSLGEFVLQAVDGLRHKSHPAPASALVADLVDAVPAFEDSGLCGEHKLIFARKAQNLVGHLAARFSDSDPRFAFADIATLSIDSGPWVIAMLRKADIIRLSPEIAGAVDDGAELTPGTPERTLRAVAVSAGAQLAAAAAAENRVLTPYQLGCYLNLRAEKEHASVAPMIHRTKGIVAY